jgi:hypothetical protein
MRTGRPIPRPTLTDDERDTLERWSRRPTTAQALAARATYSRSLSTPAGHVRPYHPFE